MEKKKVVTEIYSEKFGIPENEINFTEDLSDSLDSLDVLDLIMSLEKRYDITIPDEICEEFKTLDGIVKYLDGITKTP